MHIVILFHNVGGYHAARLRAAQAACDQNGWQLTAIQETDNAHEHPWGDLAEEITFSLKTLLPAKEGHSIEDCHPQSSLAARLLPDCLEQLQPNILLIPGWGYPISRAALKWSKRRDVPAVLMSESKWNDVPRSWWKEKIKSILYARQFQSALVGGTSHRDYLIRLGFLDKAIFEGYDVVDNNYFTQRAAQARVNRKKILSQYPEIPSRAYFITVTRFIPRKNVLRLIDAFSRYRNSVSPEKAWDLVICGSGQEEANIKSKIQAHQLENSVHLPGFQTYKMLPNWFGLASAFIHPALSEQWGLVVNEALAAGLPSLVSDRCGCYPELIVEGITGFGFDPYDVEKLASLLERLSSGEVDIARMSKTSIAHMQQYSPDAFGEGMRKSVEYALA